MPMPPICKYLNGIPFFNTIFSSFSQSFSNIAKSTSLVYWCWSSSYRYTHIASFPIKENFDIFASSSNHKASFIEGLGSKVLNCFS